MVRTVAKKKIVRVERASQKGFRSEANHHAGKVGLGKDGDRHLKRKINPGNGKNRREEEDSACGTGQPEGFLGFTRFFVRAGLFVQHQSAPPPLPAAGASSSAAGPTLTFVPSSRSEEH